MEAFEAFIKQGQFLKAANQAGIDRLARIKNGQVVRVRISQSRALWRHRKFFALLTRAFDFWTPAPLSTELGIPEKNFDVFREKLIMMAGFVETVYLPGGGSIHKAKSMSFAKMDEGEFRKLYSKVMDVIIKKVTLGLSETDVEELVGATLKFEQ